MCHPFIFFSPELELGIILQASQDEAMKQRESLVNDVVCLRGELQQVRDDRDRQSSQVEALTAEISKFKESTMKSFAELDNMTLRSNELEVCFLTFCIFCAFVFAAIILGFFYRQGVCHKVTR